METFTILSQQNERHMGTFKLNNINKQFTITVASDLKKWFPNKCRPWISAALEKVKILIAFNEINMVYKKPTIYLFDHFKCCLVCNYGDVFSLEDIMYSWKKLIGFSLLFNYVICSLNLDSRIWIFLNMDVWKPRRSQRYCENRRL